MEEIIHIGKIVAIKQDCVSVTFEKSAACSGCSSRHACALNQAQNQIVDIKIENEKKYEIGQTVELELSSSGGFTAVLYAYVLPLCLMLITLFGTLYISNDEFKAATSALVILIPYYITIFLLHKKLSNKMQIKIR